MSWTGKIMFLVLCLKGMQNIIYTKVWGSISFADLFILEGKRVERAQARGGVEGEKESQAESPLSVEPEAELCLMTLRSWPEQKPRVGCSTEWAAKEPQKYEEVFK